MEEKDNLELYEEGERKILEEYNKLDPDDPKRAELLKQLTGISAIRNNYEQTEQNRLNNNARNDIEEQKLVVQEEQTKNDKLKVLIWSGLTLLGYGLGHYDQIKSYHMEEKNFAFKGLKSYGEKMIDKAQSLFGRR